jgi:hypothetical protein
VPDDTWGEAVVAAVVPGDTTVDEIKAHCRQQAASRGVQRPERNTGCFKHPPQLSAKDSTTRTARAVEKQHTINKRFLLDMLFARAI